MCQVTVTTTTLSMTVVCTSASTTTMTVTVAPTSMGLTAALGQQEVVLPPSLIPKDTIRGFVDLSTVPWQQAESQMLSELYANYVMGMDPSLMCFSYSKLRLLVHFICCCLLWYFLSAFRFQCCCHIHQWGFNHWDFPTATLQSIPMVPPWLWSMATQEVHQVAALSTASGRGSHRLLSQLFSSHSISMMGHTAFGAQLTLCSCYMVGRGLLFQVLFHPMTWSTWNLWWALNLLIPV